MSDLVFSEKPIQIDHGDGPYLYSADGAEYLDFGASCAYVPLGHGILALPAGRTVIRLLPPLIVDGTHVNRVVSVLHETITAVGS